MKLLSTTLAVLALSLTVQVAEARVYDVAPTSEGVMQKICKGFGTFTAGTSSYYCTYANGNIRECARKSRKCIMITTKG